MDASLRYELTTLYHTARIAGAESRYDRLCWVASEYVKTHPSITPTRAYKLACEAIMWLS